MKKYVQHSSQPKTELIVQSDFHRFNKQNKYFDLKVSNGHKKNTSPILYIQWTLILSELDKITENLPFIFRMSQHEPLKHQASSFLTFWSKDSFSFLKFTEAPKSFSLYKLDLYIFPILKIKIKNPGWCGSVDWVPACNLKCRQFNSLCMGCGPGPQLQASERQQIDVSNHIDVSLPLFLPPLHSPLSKNIF